MDHKWYLAGLKCDFLSNAIGYNRMTMKPYHLAVWVYQGNGKCKCLVYFIHNIFIDVIS